MTALDAFGNVATGYTGTVTFSSSDVQAGLPASYTFTNKDAGVHTFNVTLKTAGTQSITVKDAANAALTATQSGISVTASTIAGSFVVTGFPATTAGVAQSFTVTVKDAFGNFSTGYTGTVTFSSSDVQAGLPASYTFTAADAGVHTFTATLKTAGTQSITVKDAASPTVVGSQTGIAVTGVGHGRLARRLRLPRDHGRRGAHLHRHGQGRLRQPVHRLHRHGDVQQQRRAGRPARQLHLHRGRRRRRTPSRPPSRRPARSRSPSRTRRPPPSWASQTGIAVSAAAAAQFSISAPSSVTQGVGFKFTVTVLDAYGNVVTGYRGKVHLSSTDAKGGTSDYTFSKQRQRRPRLQLHASTRWARRPSRSRTRPMTPSSAPSR